MAGNRFLERRIQSFKNFMNKYKYLNLTIWLVLSAVLLITGAVLLNSRMINNKFEKTEHGIIYSDCRYFNYYSNAEKMSCQEYYEANPYKSFDCLCDMNIDKMLKGTVTLYFELPGYAQNSTDYINSKDEDQLRGILTTSPSAQCEPFRYDNGRPIAPCGAIADSMLLDEVTSFKMIVNQSFTPDVWLIHHGMLTAEEKAGFRNPENLKYALQNFSKPTNWIKHIYDLDSDNEENNGFQNEFFISWMKTDKNRKPFARLNQTDAAFKDGLPNGTYQFFIKYYPSPLEFQGQRHLIFVAKYDVAEIINRSDGGVCLGFGVVMLAAGLLYFFYPSIKKLYSDKVRHDEEEVMRQNVDETNPPRNERNNASSPLKEDKERS